jgi:hypothetical protein
LHGSGFDVDNGHSAIAATALLTTGCYELHIVADVDEAGLVTAGSLEMLMAKETFDGLAEMDGDASAGCLEGFEEMFNQSSEDGPAVGEFVDVCTYSEKKVNLTDYYSADCVFSSAQLGETATVDQVLGLTDGKTVVADGTLTVTGSMPDDSTADESSSLGIAAGMGLKMDTTLHFANNVVSVEGEGIEIDSADPKTVIVNNLAATASDVSIVVEVPSDNTVLFIAGGVGVVVLGVIGWLVVTNRKKKTA